MEEWRDVPGYEGYQVSDHGRVRSIRRHGYKIVRGSRLRALKHDEETRKIIKGKVVAIAVTLGKKKWLVHRLILLAFRGPCPPGKEGCHEDGDGTNNKLSNLRWDTHEGNMADMARHLNRVPRWDKPLSKLQLASAYVCGCAGLV
jgi:hypothetical protein